MWESVKTLISSKRTMVALLTALFDVLLYFGLEVHPELADRLAVLVTALGGLLVVGISVSDHGKALGQPAGLDHKGRE